MPEYTAGGARTIQHFVHKFGGQPCGQTTGSKDKSLNLKTIFGLTKIRQVQRHAGGRHPHRPATGEKKPDEAYACRVQIHPLLKAGGDEVNYNKRTLDRPLSICDARYKPYVLPPEQGMDIVISKAKATGHAAAKKNEPARLARGGFRSPLALPGDRFFLVRRTHDAPIINICHHAPQHQRNLLIFNDYFSLNY